MERTLIIGIDTVAGRSVAQQLTGRAEVSGLWFNSPVPVDGCNSSRIESETLGDRIRAADAVVFCGGASYSSWDSGFGEFAAEEQWLQACLAAAQGTETRFVFISSDAVFGGPWVFHDDHGDSFADTDIAAQLLQFEAIVEQLNNSLIVRTNIAGVDSQGQGFVNRIAARLRSGESEHVDARVFATPLAASDFSELLIECLVTDLTGVINIAGAERTTAFHFAIRMAAGLGYGVEHLIPTTSNGKPCEQSLRCERLRKELKRSAPNLKETIERVVQSIADQRQPAVAA
ncbi:MAG: sugar nucleotide-binding protein [Fuerstiella sp.]